VRYEEIHEGMIVKISPECPETIKRFGSLQAGKRRLLGKTYPVTRLKEKKEEDPIIIIKGWFFDANDLMPHIAFDSYIKSPEVEKIIEENKKSKPKIYFNAESL
jgi:hypothetical protein